MFQEAKKPSEFRRYRQILIGSYLLLATSVLSLLTASVVKELFFRRPNSAMAAGLDGRGTPRSFVRPTSNELLECHGMVLNLLTTLGEETALLLSIPLRGDRGELASRWEDFSRTWRDGWDVAEARCRFSELAESNLGVAFDRLAQVHGDLPSMRLMYQSLLVRFDEEQAAEVARMRRALDLSRSAFEPDDRGSTPASSVREPSKSGI